MNSNNPATAEATIHDLSTDGRGVARVEGTVYFIPETFPGDVARVKLHPETKPPSATVLELLTPSSQRVIHPCPHADVCRGSIWGKYDYAAQLQYKRNLIERTLKKSIGAVEVKEMVASPQPWHYRHRVTLTVWEAGGILQSGFQTEARSETGVPIITCHLCEPEIDEAIAEVQRRLSTLAVSELRHIPRRIQIHQTRSGPGAMLIFPGPATSADVEDWDQLLPAPGGLWVASGTRAGILDAHQPPIPAPGAFPQLTRWLHQDVEQSPAAFTQANTPCAALVGERLSALGRTHGLHSIWDFYGGFGGLGLALANGHTPVTVCEISPSGEPALKALAPRLGHLEVSFVTGDLLRNLPHVVKSVGPHDAVIVDPPRSGCHPEVLAGIARSRAKHLIYLSCNIAKLARDLAILAKSGFAPVEVQPYDFFPQTPEIETLAILRRN